MHIEYIFKTTVMYTWQFTVIFACGLYIANTIRGWVKEKKNAED